MRESEKWNGIIPLRERDPSKNRFPPGSAVVLRVKRREKESKLLEIMRN